MTDQLYGFSLKISIINAVSQFPSSVTVTELETELLGETILKEHEKKPFKQRLYNAIKDLEKKGFLKTELGYTRLKTTYILISKPN